MNSTDLESVIRRYVILGKRSPKGFEAVKCAKCFDYKERGGFKFENGSVTYVCFNCSTKARYEAGDKEIGPSLKSVLTSFGVPEAEIARTIALEFFKPKVANQAEPTEKPKKNLEYPTIEVPLPSKSVRVESNASAWCEVAQYYLSERGLSPQDAPFFVSDETAYLGRLLIPYYFRGKIIYWQGRGMDSAIQPRYKNPSVEKENIFYNMDEIYRYTDDPLFVTEGALDSVSIGSTAVALTGSTLSEFRHRELKKAGLRRKIIFVIDKNLNGYKLGEQALREGWYVTCFPDNYDDANDVLKKLGRLWLVTHLATTAVTGFHGKLLLKMKCK